MEKKFMFDHSYLKPTQLLLWACVASTVAGISNVNAQTLTEKWRNGAIGATSNRDMAYNPATGNLLLSRTTPQINIYKSSDGTANGTLDMTGVSGGFNALYGIAVTPDGTIFACNSLTNGLLKIYMWADESAIPVVAASTNTPVNNDFYGRGMSVFVRPGVSTNFLIGGTGTAGYFLVYEGTTWTFKQLTGVSSQAMSPGGSFIDYNAPGFANRFRFIAKARGTGGLIYNFDPSATGPIALAAGTAMTGNWVFQGNGITTHDYDPATGLIGATTSTIQAAPFSFTNSIFNTTNGANVSSPTEISRLEFVATGADGGNFGGTTWGTDGRLYANIAAAGGGILGFDIGAFVIVPPASATKVAGQSVTFRSVFGGSALTYIWQKGATVLTDDAKYSGATSASLTINNLTGSDADTYTVTATDANLGTAFSSATLTISPSKAWTGGGADDNWSTANNWGGVALATSGETAVFAGTTRLMPVMDAAYDVTGLLFGSTAGAFTLTNSSSHSLTLGGTLANESANLQTIALPVILNSDQAVDIGAPVTISGSLSGSATLTKKGNSTLTLSGANTHNGAITISGGTLSATNGAAISDAGTVTLATGGILSVDTAETIGGLVGGASSVVLNEKLTIGGAGGTYTGGISGTNDLIISLTGTQAVNSASTYTGKTILTAGTLSVNDSSTFGNGTGILEFNGGTLFRTSQSTAQTFANPVLLTANSILAGNPVSGSREVRFGTTTLTSTAGTLTVTNMATSGAGILQMRITATVANCSLPIALTQGDFGLVQLVLTNNASGTQIIGGDISGNGKVVKNGTVAARISTISGNNSYSGGFDLLGGRVNLNHNNAAGIGTITIGTNQTIEFASTLVGGVVITNPISLLPTARPIFYSTTAMELTGVISGDSSTRILRNNTGAGTLTLSGDNTFGGGFTISSRTLTVKHRNALGTGTFTIGDPLAVPATAINLTAGIDLTGANAIANSVTVNTNFTVSGANGLEFSGAVTLAAVPKTITMSGAASFLRLSGSVTGSEGLTKAGAGTLELNGFNGYIGDTLVNAGSLRVNSSLSSLITVASGGTLTGIGPVNELVLTGTVAPGNGVGTLASGSQTWNGGGAYAWEINNATGTAGSDPGWDTAAINGTLNINATSGSKFNINVASLTGSVEGPAANFNNTIAQSWTIATTTSGIFGFDPAAFNIVTTGFSNSLGSASFAISTSVGGGYDLILSLVPSPQAYNFVTTGAGAGSFMGHPNTGYTIQYTDSLNPINWQNLTTVGVSGVVTTDANGLGSFADPGPLPGERYYRVSQP